MPGRPEHAKLLMRMARAAEAESAEARAREWATASDERRSAALISACIVAWHGAQATGYQKPSLPLVRLPRKRTDA
jgi:hypothetical protein